MTQYQVANVGQKESSTVMQITQEASGQAYLETDFIGDGCYEATNITSDDNDVPAVYYQSIKQS